MGAHLVSIEVEEDPHSHLCNEDQQKEHEVLGTERYRVNYGPRDVVPIPGRTPDLGIWAPQAQGLLTSPSRQRTSLTAPIQPRSPMTMVTAPTPMET